MADHTLNLTQSENLEFKDVNESEDVCGAEMTDGSTCQRDPEECQYHD